MPFLPVFLARLGASNFQVGLITSMLGIAGLLLAFVVGRFLQTRRKIVPWFSLSRLMALSCYALTGLAAILIPRRALVVSTLAIWAFATLPQTALSVCFTVVVNAVAGPEARYSLLSRRWAILGLTNFAATLLMNTVPSWSRSSKAFIVFQPSPLRSSAPPWPMVSGWEGHSWSARGCGSRDFYCLFGRESQRLPKSFRLWKSVVNLFMV